MISASFPALLQSFFTERLLHQRQASPHTIAGYRDSFRLLLHFARERLGKPPYELTVPDLNAAFIGEFLEHLEKDRGNSARTRNARLSALHSFFRYVALHEPAHALHCQRVLAIPNKRHERRPIAFLERKQIDALLAAPDTSTWTGRRDQTFLMVAIQTGLRVSELTSLQCQGVVLGVGAHVRCEGKGRKQRSTPLRQDTASMLKAWLRERKGLPTEPVFPSLRGGPLSRDAVEHLVAKHTATAQQQCPSLSGKKVTPHVLRHTAAMELLRHGVDRSV
ncbi:site-specific integrase, partial [Acidobacteria bacterium AH-259-G07]|nr:site-specific integrase [Acidobacteria bacterium AH-259-G07]